MASFFDLLDLNPHRAEKLDEEEFLSFLDADMASQKYQFDVFGDDLLYPLHMVCALGASADTVKACYKANPEAMEWKTVSMGYPIHYAAAFDAGVDVVHYLAKKDPKALQHANGQGRTPLHLACASEFGSADVVVFLTERAPKAAEMKDSDGNTPLNLACRVNPPVLAKIEDLTEGALFMCVCAKIRAMIYFGGASSWLTMCVNLHYGNKVYPNAGTERAKDETWPLWNALRESTPAEVLRDLIVSLPACVELKGPDGNSVLHRALVQEVELSALKDIVKACPKLLQKKDAEGRLPLHYAIEQRAKFSVIELLVKKCPATVDMENPGGETPFKMADRLGLPEDTVEFLNPFVEVDA